MTDNAIERQRAEPISYLSLFSGGFGLDLGMETAGFSVAACVEIAKSMRDTVRLNRPDVTVIGDGDEDMGGDLYLLTTDYILQRAGLSAGDLDLVVGGPPCQAFSILGNRQGFSDPRGNLMLEYVRVVREAQPRGFLMENVSGFLTLHHGAAYAQVLSELRKAGYGRVVTWRLNAVNYGVPQYRERVFLFGLRDDLAVRDWPIDEPSATHVGAITSSSLFETVVASDLPAHQVVRDVLLNLPANLPNHDLRPHGDRVTTRYSAMAPGSRDKIDHTDRLRWDRPSGTVLVGSGGGGGRPFIHPEEPRHLTVREAARLQSFPDDWIFVGTQTDQYRQVGNAVPRLLASAVARHIAPLLRSLNDPRSKLLGAKSDGPDRAFADAMSSSRRAG